MTSGADADDTAPMAYALPRLPEALAAALESRWRALTGSKGRGPLSPAELDRAARALLSLQRGLTGGRELIGAAYMDSAEALGAYLLYYWPASYLQARRALGRARLRPRSVLDLGSGPGPAAAACLEAGARELTLLDASPRALELARSLLAESGARVEAREWRAGESVIPAGRYDLILLSHSLNELFHGEADRARRRADFLASLAPGLSDEGRVLAIEPALLSTSRDLIAVRDLLLARGWGVEGPCIYGGPCPAYAAGEGQTCHDAFAWEPPAFAGEIARRAGLDRGELKLAWFALRPPGKPERRLPSGDWIVVSDPLLNKAGRTRYMVCGEAGRVALSAKLAGLPPACSAFASLGRGTRIRVGGAEPRGGNGMGLKADSLLEIIE